jgi:hypothetical protein
MPPKNTPSIYPYLAASFIEASEKWSTIEAIRFITQEELKGLKYEHKRSQEIKRRVHDSEARETQIFSLLNKLDRAWGSLIYTLDTETKHHMRPLMADLLMIYEYRMGKSEATQLKGLLMSHENEPYDFILEYEMDEAKKRFFIKRMNLVKHPDPDKEWEENKEVSRPGTRLG